MRMSTAEIYTRGIGAIQRQQVELARTQQQLATGRRLLSPADDPAAAVQSLKLRERIAALDQYARNATLAGNRLEQKEAVLAQMGSMLQRSRELAVSAANATQTDESRAAIARELRELADGLLDSANSQDAGGEYLFAGYRTHNRPFIRTGDGTVDYLGDSGQRRVSISPERSVAVGESGGIFMNIPRGNGVFTVAPDAGNLGTGRVAAAEVIDPGLITPDVVHIEFTAADQYRLLDGDGNEIGTGSYQAGAGIDIGGRRVVIEGKPEAGDSFAVRPAGTASLFAIVDELIAALQAPVESPAQGARLTHATQTALQDIDQALTRILEVRTGVGARLATIDSQGVSNDDQLIQLKSVLSTLEDLDYAEAISRFSMQQVTLEAAQQAYAQFGRLSLFDYIR